MGAGVHHRPEVVGAGKEVDVSWGLAEEPEQAVALLHRHGTGGLCFLGTLVHPRLQVLVELLQLPADEHLFGDVVGEAEDAVDAMNEDIEKLLD